MEEKINIAEILKGKKNGLRLYSPIFGECAFCYVREDTNDICVKKHNGVKEFFDSKGLYYNTGEVMLFPSKEMRDWEKFSWKRGDVLIGDCGFVCIFKEWASDDYTRFNGCYFDGMPNAQTAKYIKLDDNTAYGYIRELEKRCFGVLNIKTLKIEKPEFKDGDVLFVKCNDSAFIEIFNYFKNDELYDHASLCTTQKMIDIRGKYPIFKDDIVEIRLATDSEKKQLFEALAKKGKAWDSEKKEVVDLKPKWTPKPFDRVITRTPETPWTANFFSHIDSDGIKNCIDDRYIMCLPYNDETAKLIGTTNNWRG